MNAKRLLLRIARCDNVVSHFNGKDTPCSKIIKSQNIYTIRDIQVPEPWRGAIDSAPILFISSNPSWNPDDDSPKGALPDGLIQDYYNTGFPDVFPKVRLKDGSPGKDFVKFWSMIRAHAAELLSSSPREVTPGRDFAISEVVHCKSRKEYGVSDCVRECTKKYLEDLLTLSAARIIMVLGDVTMDALKLDKESMPLKKEWFGKTRYIVWLPHPNAWTARKLSSIYSKKQLKEMREFLL